MSPKLLTASLFEFGLIAAGWFLLWRLCFSKKNGPQRSPSLLPVWSLSSNTFVVAALCVVAGWITAQIVVSHLPRFYPVLGTDDTLMTIVGGSLGQLLFIAGVGAAALVIHFTEPSPRAILPAGPGLLLAGLVTSIITISVVYPTELVWQALLTWLHLPTDKQEMVEIFIRTASPLRLLGLTFMAAVLAPIGEELVFRAGLYRYLRGRLPSWAALLLPALLFASLHVDRSTWKGLVTVAPLTALGILFSLAYQRTGRISVPIVAHALFNLHTIALILLGLND